MPVRFPTFPGVIKFTEEEQVRIRRQLLGQVIDHLRATTDDQWCVGVVRTKGGTKNCILGHVFAMGADDVEGTRWWNWFEDQIATTFMIYPVNDGEDERYPQTTPRERCLAYLEDVLAGRRLSGAELEAQDELLLEGEDCEPWPPAEVAPVAELSLTTSGPPLLD